MMYFFDFYDTLFDGRAYEKSGDAPACLYNDVPETLRMLGNDAVIVTSVAKDLPDPYVEKAVAHLPRVTVLFTNGRRKADFLSEWPGYHGSPAIFVDDRVSELEAMSEKHPQIRCFEMRRDGGAGDGRWTVIRSLAELP